jgi:general stress protein 26
MSRAEVEDFLRRPLVAVLSTIDGHGYPHSVGMFYLPTDDGLRMWPYGKSQKVRNIEREPRCSVLVEDGEPYVDLKGVLLRGDASIEREPAKVFELGRAIYDRYFFPRTGIPFEQGPNERIEAQSVKRVCIEFTTARIATWDHAKGNQTGGTP